MHAQVHDPDHVMFWSVQMCKADESAARAPAPGGPEGAGAVATDMANPASLEPDSPSLTHQQAPSLPFKVWLPHQAQ